jgi:hypothetical protein
METAFTGIPTGKLFIAPVVRWGSGAPRSFLAQSVSECARPTDIVSAAVDEHEFSSLSSC